MFFFCSEQRNEPEGLQNLLGTGAVDCETHSDELSSWVGTLAGADPGQRIETQFCKLQRLTILPPTRNQTVQELSQEKKGGMVITPDNYLWTKTTDVLIQLGTCGNS